MQSVHCRQPAVLVAKAFVDTCTIRAEAGSAVEKGVSEFPLLPSDWKAFCQLSTPQRKDEWISQERTNPVLEDRSCICKALSVSLRVESVILVRVSC